MSAQIVIVSTRLLFFLFQTSLCFLLPVNTTAQKTTIDYSPLAPYGGKRAITYNKDSVPVELKEYDILGNLRRHVVVSGDSQNRLTFKEEDIYDEHKHIVSGFRKIITYKDTLDYGGKTIYRQFNP